MDYKILGRHYSEQCASVNSTNHYDYDDSLFSTVKFIGKYQIVVHFTYGSTMKSFVNICVFSLIKKSTFVFHNDAFASLTYH